MTISKLALILAVGFFSTDAMSFGAFKAKFAGGGAAAGPVNPEVAANTKVAGMMQGGTCGAASANMFNPQWYVALQNANFMSDPKVTAYLTALTNCAKNPQNKNFTNVLMAKCSSVASAGTAIADLCTAAGGNQQALESAAANNPAQMVALKTAGPRDMNCSMTLAAKADFGWLLSAFKAPQYAPFKGKIAGTVNSILNCAKNPSNKNFLNALMTSPKGCKAGLPPESITADSAYDSLVSNVRNLCTTGASSQAQMQGNKYDNFLQKVTAIGTQLQIEQHVLEAIQSQIAQAKGGLAMGDAAAAAYMSSAGAQQFQFAQIPQQVQADPAMGGGGYVDPNAGFAPPPEAAPDMSQVCSSEGTGGWAEC
jgi:hypothetical protein